MFTILFLKNVISERYPVSSRWFCTQASKVTLSRLSVLKKKTHIVVGVAKWLRDREGTEAQ